MRVLVLGPLPRLASPDYLPWLRYTVSALRRLGHEVAVATYRESWAASPAIMTRLLRIPGGSAALARCAAAMSAWRDRRTVATARAFRPELTIVLKGEVYPSELLADVKRLTNGPFTSWWLDDPFAYSQSVLDFALFDRVFLFDRSYLPRLAAAGVPHAAFLPCACDETVYRPQAVCAADRQRWATDVAFIASYYPNRAALAEAVADRVEVGIWGNGWTAAAARQEIKERPGLVRGGAVDDVTAARIYSATKVGLNVHHQQSRLGGLNMRTFELLGAGVAPLTDWIAGIEELLEPDREVVCYRSVAEAQELAAALVKDTGRRTEIGRCGRERVLAEHTYMSRMRTLCTVARA